TTPQIKPGYVLIGDEVFLYDRCRKAVLATLTPPETRDFSLHDLDLTETSIFEVLDRAQTPSLMAPFQVLFVRNLKTLYGRGSKKEEFAAIDAYFRSPNPLALILFVADHLRIPTDLRKMDYQDKERYEKIRETLGDCCGTIELARVDENDAIKWILTAAESRNIKFDPDAARELVDALGADMMLIASEFEKLLLYVSAPTANSNQEAVISTGGGASAAVVEKPASLPIPANLTKNRVTLGDVETMVLAAKQRSLYELTDAISAKDRSRALEMLDAILTTGEGDEAAIGHLYMLAKTFRQMLVILERNVRDQRMLWAALWQGFRVPPFAADDIIKQARRYKSRRQLTRAIRLVAKADLALRSNPVSKRMVLERLVMDLTTEPKLEAPGWMQEQLPV